MRSDPENPSLIAVVGAGTIGASWASQFLAKGLKVRVYDPSPDTETKTRAFIKTAWPSLQRLGLASNADPERIEFAATPAAAVEGADLVQESGPENLGAKHALYESMETALSDDTIIASSTSGFMPSSLQKNRKHPERYIVAHPFNPPHLIPLVEVVRSEKTDDSVMDWAMTFYEWLGKKPIRIEREMAGHVANRMQAALYREAIHLVLEGVASADDVDAAVAYGPGLRWAMMGPHRSHDLGGGEGGMQHLLEHIGPNIDAWWQDLGKPRINAETVEKLVSAYAATKPPSITELAKERDVLLIELLTALQRGRESLQLQEQSDE